MSFDNSDDIKVIWIDGDTKEKVYESTTSYLKHQDNFIHIYDELGDKYRRDRNIESYENDLEYRWNNVEDYIRENWFEHLYELRDKIKPLDKYSNENKIYKIEIEIHIKRDYEAEEINSLCS